MADGLEVIAPRLLDALVRGDGGVSGRASQVLSVLVGDVLALAIFVALGEPEVDDVDVVAGRLGASNQEVVRLDITVDDPLFMHLLNSLNQLDADQEARLEVESSLAGREEVFKRRSKQVHHHDMEVLVRSGTICADVVKSRHARYIDRIQSARVSG